MRSFEHLCEDIRAFAHAHPGEGDAIISDAAVYGGGMDASVAIAKLNALAKYARDEFKLTLFIENRADDAIRARPR